MNAPVKWTVQWVDATGKNWHTKRPLKQWEAADKVRKLMHKKRTSQKHATMIHLYPGPYQPPI